MVPVLLQILNNEPDKAWQNLAIITSGFWQYCLKQDFSTVFSMLKINQLVKINALVFEKYLKENRTNKMCQNGVISSSKISELPKVIMNKSDLFAFPACILQ